MREILDITKALADENRVRTLLSLRSGELCVCQITELLDLAPSTASKHLSILRQARLVEARKDGRWMYYRLAGSDAAPPVREALAWLQGSLARDAKVKEDRKRLEVIMKEDPEEICRRQMGRPGCCSSAPGTPAGARWPKAGRGT